MEVMMDRDAPTETRSYNKLSDEMLAAMASQATFPYRGKHYTLGDSDVPSAVLKKMRQYVIGRLRGLEL